MPKARINKQIRAVELRVVDEEGKMLGIIPTAEALAIAEEQGLDLVEVSPKANPPVAKLLNFDKYRYQLEKAEARQRRRQKKIELKGIRLSLRIGEHDLQFKANQAGKFLTKGNKVKVEMLLRGRERANVDFAFEVMRKFLTRVEAPHEIEQAPKKQGYIISAIITPKQ